MDSLQIDYDIMGGAAACLLAQDPNLTTEDVDLVIHVDHRMITADRLTSQLLSSYPSDIAAIELCGHIIPGFKLSLMGGGFEVVKLEIFDYYSWPERPQYDIETASRKSINVNGQMVKLFSPEWILREKILSQYEREGTLKEAINLRDVVTMLSLVIPGKPELYFYDDKLKNALETIGEKACSGAAFAREDNLYSGVWNLVEVSLCSK